MFFSEMHHNALPTFAKYAIDLFLAKRCSSFFTYDSDVRSFVQKQKQNNKVL